jgi:hypothetical protein
MQIFFLCPRTWWIKGKITQKLNKKLAGSQPKKSKCPGTLGTGTGLIEHAATAARMLVHVPKSSLLSVPVARPPFTLASLATPTPRANAPLAAPLAALGAASPRCRPSGPPPERRAREDVPCAWRARARAHMRRPARCAPRPAPHRGRGALGGPLLAAGRSSGNRRSRGAGTDANAAPCGSRWGPRQPWAPAERAPSAGMAEGEGAHRAGRPAGPAVRHARWGWGASSCSNSGRWIRTTTLDS